MRNAIARWKAIVLCSVMFCLPEVVLAEQGTSCDSVPHPSGYAENLLRRESYSRYPELTENVGSAGVYIPHRFIHRLGIEARPQYVFPTNPFLQGENERWKPVQASFAAHLKYSFKFRPNTCADRIYGGAYQGVGVSFRLLAIRNSWAILSLSMYFKAPGSLVSPPVSRSIMSGISVCLPDGSLMTITIIPIMVLSGHG